ncbi:MAG: helix-turn-helix domain-containing protein [Acidobacteriota bacterium]|nr:MAG: helix-turn-helix domain-containing protein [Acidobacteriota bacterium]
MERRLLSVSEAAKYLAVRKSTLYSWAQRRRIPSVKIGRRLLFDREDLDRLIVEQKRFGLGMRP